MLLCVCREAVDLAMKELVKIEQHLIERENRIDKSKWETIQTEIKITKETNPIETG